MGVMENRETGWEVMIEVGSTHGEEEGLGLNSHGKEERKKLDEGWMMGGTVEEVI